MLASMYMTACHLNIDALAAKSEGSALDTRHSATSLVISVSFVAC